MTLLKKISGIRGTIGGKAGTALTPVDVVEMTAAYGAMLHQKKLNKKVVVGRDARISGSIVSSLAIATLQSMGFDVIDLGLSTTPTVEMAVLFENAAGGIIFTASHNPKEWNALKLLNENGEFISEADGIRLLKIAEERSYIFSNVENLGSYASNKGLLQKHISKILELQFLDIAKIKDCHFKIVVDCINSTGALSIPPLLDLLNCEYVLINAEMSGDFNHDPEPLPENLRQLSENVKLQSADLGIAVDPDVDRLVFVCEDGTMFGEEYTIVAAADFLLSKKPGPTVSNMSSSRALADIAHKYKQEHFASAVGEVNVVEKMKSVNATIGGEGNGGVIIPDLHYGRDALVGIVLVLNLLAERKTTMSQLKATYPSYKIIKRKFEIDPDLEIDNLLNKIKNNYLQFKINEEDGLRIDFENSWVHLRKSNTEPVIRLIAEALTTEKAESIIEEFNHQINSL